MARSCVEISAVHSGDELLNSWVELGYSPPAPEGKENLIKEAWARAVEADTHDILVARLGAIATGFVVIKYDGPVSFEPEFSEALKILFPDQVPIPTIYSLNVLEQHRGKRIGSELMEAAEKTIADNADLPALAALSVEVSNDPAVNLYRNRDYRTISRKDIGGEESGIDENDEQTWFTIDHPVQDERGTWVPGIEKVYFMVKDLSDRRQTTGRA